ncbi:MAG: glycosyltransferase [Micrococcales bacterium]|nr:glycosyltransferase [Micrococcales bacterium]
MSCPEVSVVLPVHNAGRALPATLSALAAQTCTSLEIVVVDDGSTDGTGDILREYPQVTVVHQRNQGVWRARQQGVARTTGRYVGFCDADDLPHPRLYATLAARAAATGADMVVSAYRRVDLTDGHVMGVEMQRPTDAVLRPDQDPQGFASVNTALWNKLFDGDLVRRVAQAVGDEDSLLYFDPPPRIMEDMLVVAACLPWLQTVTFVPEPLYDYMVRPGAMMTTLRPAEAHDLAAHLAAVRSWVVAQADGRPLAAAVDAMAFVHFGLSALASLSASSSPSTTRTYWRLMRDRLRRDFPGYTDQAPGTAAAARLRLALWLDRCHALVPAMHGYTGLARVTGWDARW